MTDQDRRLIKDYLPIKAISAVVQKVRPQGTHLDAAPVVGTVAAVCSWWHLALLGTMDDAEAAGKRASLWKSCERSVGDWASPTPPIRHELGPVHIGHPREGQLELILSIGEAARRTGQTAKAVRNRLNEVGVTSQ